MALATWNSLRKLRREKSDLLNSIALLDANSEELKKKGGRLFRIRQELEGLETDEIMAKVYRLGIELPEKRADWWWDDLDYMGPDSFRSYLTPKGKSYVWKLIKDERKKNVEFWIKTIGGFIPMLTALAGTVAAILAVLSKWNS